MSFSLAAQNNLNDTALSVKQAIELGVSHNKKIIQQRLRVEMSELQVKVIKKEHLPEIDFHSGLNVLSNLNQFEHGISEASTSYELPRFQYDFTLSAEIPIYVGGRITNHKKIAELSTEMQETQLFKDERKLRLEIITAYLNALHLEEQAQFIQEKIHEDLANIDQTKHLLANGLVTDNEVLRTKLQLSNHQLALSDLEKELEILAEKLKPMLGFEGSGTLKMETSGLMTQELRLQLEEGDVEMALRNSEVLKLSKLELQQSELERKIVKAAYLPSLTAGGEYGFSYPNFKFFPPEAFIYRFGLVGVKLQVPISSLYKNREKMSIAKLAIEHAHLEVEEEVEVISAEVFEAQKKYEQAIYKVKIAEEAIGLAQENYRIVKTKYANQLSLITELMDADNAYLAARSSFISLTIDKQLKFYQLQYRLGNL